jgi:hypothetical protein
LGWTAWQTWTGFGETIVEDGTTTPAKTLWDWSELLVIPLGVAYIASRFTKSLKQNEIKIAEQRSMREQEISLDQQRENALQSYLDRITELLLREGDGLKTSGLEDEIRVVARARTLSTLNMLDPTRKGQLLRCLYEGKLVSKENTIISLKGADLREAVLTGTELSNIDLSKADLREAVLIGTDLSEADLSKADLREADLRGAVLKGTVLMDTVLWRADLYRADLSGADLRRAVLRGAILWRAILKGAILRGTILRGADLRGADLRGADLRGAELKDMKMETAVMPDGNIYDPEIHQNIFVKSQ